MAARKRTKKRKKKSAHPEATTPVTATTDVAGRLEVPSGGAFTVDVKVFKAPPLWSVSLVGQGFNLSVGSDQSPFTRTIQGLADGFYVLTMEATLATDDGRFQLIARSDIDDERKELVKIPDTAKRIDMMPVVVGLGG